VISSQSRSAGTDTDLWAIPIRRVSAVSLAWFPTRSFLPCPYRNELDRLSEGAVVHDVLRSRLLRKIESLPEIQVYQVLDYIEFLESKYSGDVADEASGLQRLAEGLEDSLRKRAFNPGNLREAFQLISAADRALSGVAQAGRQLLGDLALTDDDPDSPQKEGLPQTSEPDPARDAKNEDPSSE